MRTLSFRNAVMPVLFAVAALNLPTAARADLGWLFPSGSADWLSLKPIEDIQPARFSPVERTPEMFGDTFIGLLDVYTDNDGIESTAHLPFPGGSNRLVIANNNSALIQDRFYVTFDHVQGSLSATSQSASINGASLDRTTLGIEKSFFDQRFSLEVRLPFAAERDFTFSRFSVQNDGQFGNIGLISKLQLWKNESTVTSAGVAVQIPTGGDITGEFDGSRFTIENDAVYVSPFVAFATTPGNNWFYQGFGQIDVSASGNTFSGQGVSGEYDNQSLLRLSLGGGRWFFQRDDGLFRGLAGIAELHYTSTLEDSDPIVHANMMTARTQILSNTRNREDILNLTSGLHLELPGNANARVGVNVPLRDEQRFHDATLMVQVNIGL